MPTTIKRILCPTDFSETSAHALAHATAIARWYRASLSVLHVYDSILATVPGMPVDRDGIPDADLRRIREQIATSSRAATAAGVPVEALVDVGRPAAAILDRAAALPADLIVIGTHGVSGFEHLLLGSITEKVLRKASCPVLTVPPRASGSTLPFRRILCAVDFSDWSLRAFELARSLAQESGAALTVLSCIEWPWEESPTPIYEGMPAEQAAALNEYRRYVEAGATRRLKALAEDEAGGVRVDTRVSHGKPAARILRTATDVNADLIVIGVHGRKGIDISVFGSTANQVVRQATCPVATLRS
jgi:nucleotide-binding universal stress UspA family protein